MMSGSKTVSSGEQLSPRVLELRRKIHDESYVDSAVQRIALVLSRKLIENRVAAGK